MKKRLAARFVDATGLRTLLARLLPRDGVVILNYHRIGDGHASPYDRALWSASEEGFDAQLRFLKRSCDVIGLDQLDGALHARRGRHVAITFDDGYLDNYRMAYPALRRHGLPATFFIATGFIDAPKLPWWDEIAACVRRSTATSLDLRDWFEQPVPLGLGDREDTIVALLRKYKSLPCADAQAFLVRLREQAAIAQVDAAEPREHWMDWGMIREMAGGGMAIGGHTITHPVLSALPRERQRDEISGCAQRLQQELGAPMRWFAYPVGSPWAFNNDTKACLEELGVERAFSYYGGVATRHAQRYDVPRIAIESDTEPALFRAVAELPQVFCRRPDE